MVVRVVEEGRILSRMEIWEPNDPKNKNALNKEQLMLKTILMHLHPKVHVALPTYSMEPSCTIAP